MDTAEIMNAVRDLKNLHNNIERIRKELDEERLKGAPEKAARILDRVLEIKQGDVSQQHYDDFSTAVELAEEHRKKEAELHKAEKKYNETKERILGLGPPGPGWSSQPF